MCGILVFSSELNEYFQSIDNKSIPPSFSCNPDAFLALRGPDAVNEMECSGLVMRHYHLKMSLNPMDQPLQQGSLRAIYNGEIYNTNTNLIDGANILPSFLEDGILFSNLLDGEYAIILHDSSAHRLYLTTDPFGMKPLFFAITERGIVASSYRSVIARAGFKPMRVAANTTICINLVDYVVEQVIHPHSWCTDATPTDLDDWCSYFELAMDKRINSTTQHIYYGLSGGYDSGIISCYISKLQKHDALAIAVINDNEQDVQFARIARLPKAEVLSWSPFLEQQSIKYSSNNIEPLDCVEYSSGTGYYSKKPMIEDSGFKKLIQVCATAHELGHKVFIDGMGGDEIYSDYGYNGQRLGIHSNFGGLFPENINLLVPSNPYDQRAVWASFYNSTMSTYLSKGEHVVGSFGHESRYPLLDKHLVECFLRLPSRIKNSAYKAPISYYLTLHNWPVCKDVKHGF